MHRRYKNSFFEGKKAEERFKTLMELAGLKCTATPDNKSQCRDHIDFIVKSPRKPAVAVEVKAMKRHKRNDSNTDDTKLWIEFKNVRGNLGWLYGKADLLAFERPAGFSFIKRTALLEWAEKNIDLTNPVSSAKLAYLKGYTRKDRADLIAFVNFEDIVHLISFEVNNDGKIIK